MAAIGQPDVKGKLLKGYSAGGKTYRVHLDGYSQLPMLQDGAPARARSSPMTTPCPPCVTTTGKCCSRFSAHMVLTSGRSRTSRCGFRCCSTCGWIRSSAPKNRQTIRAGALTIYGRCCHEQFVGQFLQTFKGFATRKIRQLQPRSGVAEDAARWRRE
jgi:hypothetical protein